MSRWLLTISSGMGPIEVRCFVRLLAQELARELPARGAALESSFVHGSEMQPHSVDLAVVSERGVLADLLGTHVLLLQSALRGKRSRKRWFAAVSCTQFVPTTARVCVDARDVVFETCRAGGAGGQHVNRTESAVRALHVPTGIRVRVESERSAHQNKRRALEALASMLAEQHIAARAEQHRERRLRSLRVERGRPVAVWRREDDGLVRVGVADACE